MDADDFGNENLIEVTYSAFEFDEIGETTFVMEISENELEWMLDMEDDGEILDSEFMSEKRRSLHRKILKAIFNDMEERGMDDEDGMVPHKYASLVKDFHPKASHEQMHTFAEEEDVDYSVVTL